jgi:uncharacterized metal-binding protein YceD (DUF177 family)
MRDRQDDAGLLQHFVSIAELPDAGATFQIEANDLARGDVARRLGVERVDRLCGQVTLEPFEQEVVATGQVEALLLRECVASLEPFVEPVADEFRIRFVRDLAAHTNQETLLDFETFELLDGPTLDIGELMVQQVALAMSPYPRKPDAEPLTRDYGEAGSVSPFSVLSGKIAGSGEQE